ncbi:MAG TPA: DUF2062 domain-containing protein [Holophagaceae bacterium]
MKAWFRARVIGPLAAQVRQGLSPSGLAWGLAVGLGLGTFPVLGTTTLLCLGVGLAFRMNHPALQTANYLAYPFQIALLVPEVRVGAWILGTPRVPLSLSGLAASARVDPLRTLSTFGTTLGHACLGWLVLVPPLVLVTALVLTPLFRALARFRGPSGGT